MTLLDYYGAPVISIHALRKESDVELMPSISLN